MSTSTDRFSHGDLVEMYRRMLRMRGFETRVAARYRDGEVPGFVHLSIRQEASAVGACWPLRPNDVITSTHRGHGHCIAEGLDPDGMFAELMAKDSGTNRGRGGSMHIADPRLGIFGANGIVGAGLPIAAGAATAAQQRGEGTVVVAFFGDGAVTQGAFHEAVNLAAVWHLPLVLWCENNGYAEFSSAAAQHAASLEQRAAGYGVDFEHVDGNDVVAATGLMTDIVERVRSGAGTVMVEATTYRWHGHYEGDPERYRDAAELEEWKQRDPIVTLRDRLRHSGTEDRVLAELEAAIQKQLDIGAEAARAAAPPSVDTLANFVTRPRPEWPEPAAPPTDAPTFRMMDAIHSPLEMELATDPEVFVAPLDMDTVLASVHKKSRLLIAHEAVVPFGLGAEIAATAAREAFWSLDAPIERVGAAPTPAPYAPELERAWLPDGTTIAAALRRIAAA